MSCEAATLKDSSSKFQALRTAEQRAAALRRVVRWNLAKALVGSRREREVWAMLDSGTSEALISNETVKTLNAPVILSPRPFALETANGLIESESTTELNFLL